MEDQSGARGHTVNRQDANQPRKEQIAGENNHWHGNMNVSR